MPTNLPPEYFDAEKRYREATTHQEKIAALEDIISTVPKHKGTDKLRADLRRRLSQLRESALKRRRTGKGDLYSVEKQGAAQVVLAGFANSGKSSVLKSLTNANPVIADYPMTTVMPLTGMMPFEDIQFQIVDLPPIGNDSTDGWVSGVMRYSDMLLLVLDLPEDPDIQAELLIEQLLRWGIAILKKGERFLEKRSIIPKPFIIAVNKLDLDPAGEGLEKVVGRYGASYPVVGVSAKTGGGVENLRQAIFEESRIIRVYSKEPGKEPDIKVPFTLLKGSTVLDLAELIHKDFVKNLKYVCIWGSVRYGGQRVQKDHVLQDRDVVEYHIA
jgi:ribosome-interacting GTPase 1